MECLNTFSKGQKTPASAILLTEVNYKMALPLQHNRHSTYISCLANESYFDMVNRIASDRPNGSVLGRVYTALMSSKGEWPQSSGGMAVGTAATAPAPEATATHYLKIGLAIVIMPDAFGIT